MITEQEVREILKQHNLRDWGVSYLNSQNVMVWLGERPERPCQYLVTFYPRHRTMYIGNSLIGHSGSWVEWWNFTPGEIGLRGIDLNWWKKHRPALLGICALIESKFSGPVNCRPDICT